MKDFLVWYNNTDVGPFLEAIDVQVSMYKEKGIDMLKQCVSLPGAAHLWLMQVCDHSKEVVAPQTWIDFCKEASSDVKLREHISKQIPVMNINEDYRELYSKCRKNTVGGPSIIFHRYHEANVTKIREAEYGSGGEYCRSIQGFDANALYAFCVAQSQPVGHPVVCKYSNNVLSESSHPGTSGWSIKCHVWLSYLCTKYGYPIQYHHNGGEVTLGRHGARVDGYDCKSNTAYEFLGCYWHGHGCATNASVTEQQTDRFEATCNKLTYLSRLGYNVVALWECEWDKTIRENATAARFSIMFREEWYPSLPALSTIVSVIRSVRDGSFFGLVECDIHVPEHLYDKFSEMSPLFGHTKLGDEILSDHMRTFVREHNIAPSANRGLVGAMAAKKMLLHSDLLRWYLDEGLEVSMVHSTYRYIKRVAFADFVDQATASRRAGDADPSLTLHANMAKLSVNSVYGKTITNKESHRNVIYSKDTSHISSVVASDRFVSLDEVGDICELVKQKKTLDMDVPVVIGFCILQLAKLRMLQFYYNCIDRYIERKHFQYIEMDTDSAYMALSAPLQDVIKHDLKRSFWDEYDQWFPRLACQVHKTEFVECMVGGGDWKQEDCCRSVTKHDSRTPGLFKQEFSGTAMVALNSKTYVCWNTETDETKASAKGISKRLNELEGKTYKDVLTTGQPFTGTNIGFRYLNNSMYTYKQMRAGLTYYYAKRQVGPDGVSTSPLTVTLNFE